MYTGSKTEGGVFRNGTFSEFNVKQNLRDEKKKKKITFQDVLF